jgi:hypothetical protein
MAMGGKSKRSIFFEKREFINGKVVEVRGISTWQPGRSRDKNK